MSDKPRNVLQLVSSNNKQKENLHNSAIELLEGLLLEIKEGNLKNTTHACVILMDDTDFGSEEMTMVNTDIEPMRVIGMLELMKQRTLLSEYRTLRSELGGKQLNFALRGRQVHAFRGGSAGFVLVALFFVARVGSALFVCVVVVGAFIVLFLILFDVACCGIVQGT